MPLRPPTRSQLLVLLAAVLALSSEAFSVLHAGPGKTDHAGTLDDPIPIRFGETYRGVMPPGRGLHGFDSDRWLTSYKGLLPETQRVFAIKRAPSGAVTVEVDSLDFQIGVRHRVPDSTPASMPTIYLNGWHDVATTAFAGQGECSRLHACRLRIERTGDEDSVIEVFPARGDSGGEFVVRLLPAQPLVQGETAHPYRQLDLWREWEETARERGNLEREWYSVFYQALYLMNDGRIEEAGPVMARATEIARQIATPGDFRLAIVLQSSARLAKERDDATAAKVLREQSRAMQTEYWERYLSRARESGDVESEWTALRYGGVLGLQYGHFREEVPFRHVRMLEIARELYVPGDLRAGIRLAMSLRTAATVPGGDRTPGEKKEFLEEAVEIIESVMGRGHEEVGWYLKDLGWHYHEMGWFEEALSVMERKLSICRASHPTAHYHLGEGLAWIGSVEIDLGRYHEAKEHIEEALAIYRELVPEWFRVQALPVAHLGKLNERLGSYDEAYKNYSRRYEILRRNHMERDPTTLETLGKMVEMLIESGRFEEAWESIERIRESARFLEEGVNSAFVAGLLHIPAAKVLLVRGMQKEASVEADRAAALVTESIDPESRGWRSYYIGVHKDLAQLFRHLGNPEKARHWAQRAADLSQQFYGAEHPETARCLTVLAGVLGDLGAPGAMEMALRVERVGRDDLRIAASVLSETRALEFAAARLPALDVALDVAAAAKIVAPATAGDLLDAVIRSRSLVLDEVAVRNRAAAEASRITQEGLRGDGETANEASRIADLYENLKSTSTRLANLLVRDPEGPMGTRESDPEALMRHRGFVETARREMEEAEEALAVESRSFRESLAHKRAGLAGVVSSLPSDAALVAYRRYERGRAAAGSPAQAYAAFVLSPGERLPVFIPLSSAPAVEAVVRQWQGAVSLESTMRGLGGLVTAGPDTAENSLHTEGAEYRQIGKKLRHLAWDPVASHLGGAKRVLIVPDGALSLVNFAALPADDGGYLLEKGPVIHYLSAERDLVRRRQEARSGGSLLAMGGVDFEAGALFAALRADGSGDGKETSGKMGMEAERSEEPVASSDMVPGGAVATIAQRNPFRGDRSACTTFRDREFEPLPASEREVDEIASLWEAASHPGRAATGADLAKRLTGPAASESAFKDLGPGRGVLHLATHGFFLGGRCRSALEPRRGLGAVAAAGVGEERARNEDIEAGAAGTPVREAATSLGENPLVLSGLVLAGANNREHAGPDEDDGILTAQEIAAMDLSSVQWAVLSACDTGVGEIRAGEGVFGLRRAFQVAGADTLIMSLWSVEDESARRWMKALYEGRLTKGMDTSEAVRHASLTVLNHRRDRGLSDHPFYWAGFVAAGDWR